MMTLKNRFTNQSRQVLISFALLLITLNTTQVNTQERDSLNVDEKKAIDILNMSRKSLYKNQNGSSANSYKLVFEVERNTVFTPKNGNKLSETLSGNREFSILLPDKAKYFDQLGKPEYSLVSEATMNNTVFREENYSIQLGKRVNTGIVTENTNDNTQEQKKLWFRTNNFLSLFPLLLAIDNVKEYKFVYVGKGESEGKSLEILESILPNGEIAKILFETQNYLPVAIITSKTRGRDINQFDRKYGFSEYSLSNSFLVARKLIIVQRQSMSNGDILMTDFASLKSIQINPTFKPNFFVVKKK